MTEYEKITGAEPHEVQIKWDTGSMHICPEEIVTDAINISKLKKIMKLAVKSDTEYGTGAVCRIKHYVKQAYDLVDALKLSTYHDICAACMTTRDELTNIRNNAADRLLPDTNEPRTNLKYPSKEINTNLKKVRELITEFNKYDRMLDNITRAQNLIDQA